MSDNLPRTELLAKPSERVLKALASLNANAEYADVVEWLSDSLENLKTNMVVANDDVLLRRLQGAAGALGDLGIYLTNARGYLDTSRASGARGKFTG